MFRRTVPPVEVLQEMGYTRRQIMVKNCKRKTTAFTFPEDLAGIEGTISQL